MIEDRCSGHPGAAPTQPHRSGLGNIVAEEAINLE